MLTHRLARSLAVLLVSASVALSPLRVVGRAVQAQEAAGDQRPTFRSGIDAVTVDVIVTDKQGNPVTDLTRDDFDIRESGKPQTVDTFKFVQVDDGRDDPRAERDILSVDEQRREAAREDNRLFVVFLDEYHVRRGNSMAARDRLSQFIAQLTPHDLVGVVTPLSLIGGLTLSRNHSATASIIREFEGRKYDYTPRNAYERQFELLPPEAQEQARNEMVMGALRNLCEQLGSMRDGRKTILYVSEGMSGSIPAGVRTRGNYVPGRPAGVQLPNEQSRTYFDSAALQSSMQQVYAAANRNNVAVYTVDPRGLANFEFGIDEDVTSADDRRLLVEATDMMRVLASQTDGRAIINANDPLPALKQMVRDNSAYYLLGYTSTLAPRDGKFHEIQVRVKRPGVEVRARKGYWAYTAEDVARATAPAVRRTAPAEDVTAAIDALSTVADGARARAVTAWLGSTRGEGPNAAVTFVWEAASTSPVEAMDTVDRVSVVANAVTGEELYRGTIARDPQMSRPGGQVTFAAPAGPVRVRLTAENARGLRIDSDEAATVVPDFTAAGPQLSSAFVYRGRTARDIQQIRGGAAGVPVVKRVFTRTERLFIRFGAFAPAGHVPSITMRLLNHAGTSIASLPDPGAGKGPNTFESELTLGAFPPGDYLIEIVAQASGESARQLIAIRVTG